VDDVLKKMKKRMVVRGCGESAAGGCGCSQRAGRGGWYAASTNAISITGDIAISKGKFRSTSSVSAGADSHVEAGGGERGVRRRCERGDQRDALPAEDPGGAALSAKEHFVRGRGYAVDGDLRYGHTLEVAFFSGDDMPVFTFDAISKSTALCGTFAYSR
jgi:hypothetical protein